MINVGIIGLGRSGWELHADPLSRLSDFKLAAVSDQSPSRLSEAARVFDAQVYEDSQALINAPDVQLVVIAAPSNLHASLAIEALDAGKDVVVEKPMAITLAEADDMLAAAKRNRRLLAAFHNRHWDLDYQMVKRLVQEGQLGQLLTLDSRVMTYGPEWATYGVPEFNPKWRTQSAWGGGFLADWGPHLVEQVLDMTEEWPTSVSCQLRSHLWATEVEDYFFIRLAFPSGLLVTLEGSNNARFPLPRWFIVGSEGTMMADGTWGKWTDIRLQRPVAGVTTELIPQGLGATSGSRNYDVGETLSACFYQDLALALGNGQQPAVTAQRARNVMAILEAARESNVSGSTVALAPPK